MRILQQNGVSSGRDELQQRGGHRIGGFDLRIVTDSVQADDIRPLDAAPEIGSLRPLMWRSATGVRSSASTHLCP